MFISGMVLDAFGFINLSFTGIFPSLAQLGVVSQYLG